MKTTKTAIAIALVIGAMITLFIGCGPADSDPVPSATPRESRETVESETDPGNGLVIEDGAVVISMYAGGGQNYNDPVGVRVEPGTTIRFVNRSGMNSTTAYHPDNGRDARIPDGAESWDSGLMTRRNASFEVTLTVEGVYDFFCIPHEIMGHVGRIVVGDPDAFPALPTDGLPRAAADALPSVETIMAEQVVRP